ncbi:MAG: purine-nucleoside phosphorylase [Verrucomicrobiota bacterium]
MVEGDALETLRGWGVDLAIILGSGLGEALPAAQRVIPYSAFSEIPSPTVPGHAGTFSLTNAGNTPLLAARGRVHLYEGHSARSVTAVVRILAAAGIKRLIVTNAAGGLNEKFVPGDWMMLSDHLNLTGTSPLLGTASFHDLSEAYSIRWRQSFREAAGSLGLTMREGVYAAVPGPQYETPAEARMLRHLGADAVGMSTVLEVIQARALGLEVAGFSCITNVAAGIEAGGVSHADVVARGQEAAIDLRRLLEKALANARATG